MAATAVDRAFAAPENLIFKDNQKFIVKWNESSSQLHETVENFTLESQEKAGILFEAVNYQGKAKDRGSARSVTSEILKGAITIL